MNPLPDSSAGRVDKLICDPATSDASDLATIHPPLMRVATARRALAGVFLFVVVVQIIYWIWIGNGLGKFSDAHSEADALRSAEAYARDGLLSHHGLPRLLYGGRFPDVGTIIDHLDKDGLVKPVFRTGFPDNLANRDDWVYTHYPPGPNWLCGVMARFFGTDQIRFLRLLPMVFGLVATAIFFKTSAGAFGADRAALIAGACAVLPMFHTCMPGLHFEGYSFALLLLQFSLLISPLWNGKQRLWHWPALFLFGFAQGWLSFDQFFVVTLLSWPLWLLRRAEGAELSFRWLFLTAALPCAGFGLAHFLHLAQVSAELGGWHPAIEEFRRTATERAGQADLPLPPFLEMLLRHIPVGSGYFRSLALGGYFYLRQVLILRGPYFGPFMIAAIAAALLVLCFRPSQITRTPWHSRGATWTLSWPGSKRPWPALAAALFVSLVWWPVMAGHVAGNAGVTIRHLFVFYLFLVLVVVKSISVTKEEDRPV